MNLQKDYDAEAELSNHLNPGESLLWAGRPKKGLVFRSSDIFVIPFSLLWCGFAIFWESSVLRSDAPVMFRLFGIPFVCIGLYVVIGRFFADAYKRSKTVYGITAGRIIIRTGIFRMETQSLPMSTLPYMTLTERNNGSGSIRFGSEPAGRMQNIEGVNWPGSRYAPRIELVDNVKYIYNLVVRLQDARK